MFNWVSPSGCVASGDASYKKSSRGVLHQKVTRSHTTTAVISSANPLVGGSRITFTATVSAVAPGAGAPKGKVRFFVNGRQIGVSRVLAHGQASFTLRLTRPAGTYSVTALYSGSGHFWGSLSEAYDLTIT